MPVRGRQGFRAASTERPLALPLRYHPQQWHNARRSAGRNNIEDLVDPNVLRWRTASWQVGKSLCPQDNPLENQFFSVICAFSRHLIFHRLLNHPIFFCEVATFSQLFAVKIWDNTFKTLAQTLKLLPLNSAKSRLQRWRHLQKRLQLGYFWKFHP